MMRAFAPSVTLLGLVGCATQEVWTGATCFDAGACARDLSDAGPDSPDAQLAARPGCPTGRFSIVVVASYASSASGVCFVTGPSDQLVADGTWQLSVVSRPAENGVAAIEGCIRVPGQGEDAGMSDIDWRAAVRGQMDCNSGELRGEIRATYNVVSVCTLGILPTRYFATGPMLGHYDPALDAFRDGSLDMREPPVLIGERPGGSGTWHGGRATEDASPLVTEEHACLGGLSFPDAQFASDGGAASSDAASAAGAQGSSPSALDADSGTTP